MAMREAVRSGRRANFFITENSFIDHYAALVGGSGVAVYFVLQRCANSETRETWISASRVAELLGIDRSTVYRKLKELEDLRLIRSMRTREKTIYVVLAVPPPRPKIGPAPLFDNIEAEPVDAHSVWPLSTVPPSINCAGTNDSHCGDSSVASAQHTVASGQRTVAPAQLVCRSGENANKEEQDSVNKTQEQYFFNKNWEDDETKVQETACRVLNVLELPESSLAAAVAAVRQKARTTRLSSDGVVQEIATAARYAERRGIETRDFLDDFLAQASAQKILNDLGLPVTNSLVATVTAAIKAEVGYSGGLPVEEVTAFITTAALDDSRRGVVLDRFYFENVKWRVNARISKAERRTLDNLDVNARVKQRLRERLRAPGVDHR